MERQQWSILIAISAVFLQTFSTANSSPEADKITSLPGQPQANFQQYAGYVAVDETQQRQLFYYFVEAQTDPTSKPLVLWLTGGESWNNDLKVMAFSLRYIIGSTKRPGCSSLGGGAFVEHGPFKPSGDILLKNPFSWNTEANMLYLESPAGVGFSYSSNQTFYSLANDVLTAQDSLVFLQRWFDKFPEFKNRDFFITGESYGGHYVPQLAQLVLQSKQFNLKGIAIGNPLLDFNTDFNSKAEYLWSHGLISDATLEMFTHVCNYSSILRQMIEAGTLTPACAQVNSQVDTEVSKYINQYDVTLDICLSSADAQSRTLTQPKGIGNIDVCLEDETVKYLNRKDVQVALHARLVGVSNWSICSSVLRYHQKNLETPMLPVLSALVKSGIRIMVYSGDQDPVIPLIGTRTLVNKLANYLQLNTTVPYRVWFEEKQVAGWTQVYSDVLSFATIRGAAHIAPFTQPERSLLLFSSFLEGKPLPDALTH